MHAPRSPSILAAVLTGLMQVFPLAAVDFVPVSGIDRRAMRDAARPQDDFNEYANGAWLEQTAIPADRPAWGTFAMLRQESEAQQHAIIGDLAARGDLVAGSDEQKVGELYASLMHEMLADAGVAPWVREQLDRIDALATVDDLLRAFAELGKVGVDAPGVLYVTVDSHDTARYAVFLTQAGLGLPNRNYYLDQSPRLEELRAHYPSYIAQLLRLAGQPDGVGVAARIVALETKLAAAQWSPEDSRDATKTDNRFAVVDLAQVSDRINWSVWLAAAGLPQLEYLYVRQPDYFARLGALLQDEPLEDWKHYLRFHVLNAAAPWMADEFFQAHHGFFGARVNGVDAPQPRWQRAVQAVNDAMGEAVGRIYVARHFPPEAKQRMDTLVQNLLRAFEISLDRLAWMTPATKAQAQAKRAKLGTKIGHPVRWEDYAALVIQRDDPIGNLARAATWDYERRLRRLDDPVDRDEWSMTPQTVNAYFSSRLNEIVFPAAILQPPFFNLAADDAVNYGAIGAVIGHEIGHAFDDQGRKTDADGNLRDWWTPADAAAFAARADVLVTQYEKFEVLPGLRVNGRLTLGENIGDLTGVYIAYLAYQTSLAGRAAPVIDGFTGAQRFFLGYAQIFRSKLRPEFARRIVLTDPHAPGQFRINGALRNFAPFYEAFGVREGDGMFLPSTERVTIW